MLCPVCKNVELVMSERQGIEIDYCPNCRGVWLDRGELDKIIERTLQSKTARAPQPGQAGHPALPAATGGYARPQHHGEHHHDEHGRLGHHGQRHSFWKDLFD